MKKIKTIISIFIMTAIVVVSVVPVRVHAADVESLPAFSNDITVTYDGSGVLFKTSEYEQYLYFNQSLKVGDAYINEYHTDGSFSTINFPGLYHSDTVDSGHFSYWYSANESRVYVLAALNGIYEIKSYMDGVFNFMYYPSDYYMSLSYYDLVSGDFFPVAMKNNKYGGMSSGYSRYIDVDGQIRYLPDDLLCIYSNYMISGFYEPEASEIYTPDYYFKYQYLFHVDGVGYTFIDSAHPLVSISNDDPLKAILKFKDICNKHVYTSVNGSAWNSLTTLDNMYGNSTTLDYRYFYDAPAGTSVYTLVYTNDLDYDIPLILPEYGDMEDISELLGNYTYDEFYDEIVSESIQIGGDDRNFASLISHFLIGNAAGAIDAINKLIYDDGITVNSFALDYLFAANSIMSELTSDISSVYYIDDNGYLHNIEQTSLRTYIKSLSKDMDDLVICMMSFQATVHKDLQSVFDNISITNTYLYDVKKLIKDLPDYTKDIRELKAAIEAIDLQSPDVVVPDIDISDINIPDYTQELEDIRVLLENLDVNISVPSDGNVMLDVPEFDDSDILHSLTGIQTSVNYIGGLMTVNTVTDIFRDIFDEEEDDAEDIGEFITNAITIINTNKLLTAAFEYMGSLSNGITWVNLNVQHIFDVSGALRGVLLLGVTLFCVNLIVRRNG